MNISKFKYKKKKKKKKKKIKNDKKHTSKDHIPFPFERLWVKYALTRLYEGKWKSVEKVVSNLGFYSHLLHIY